MTENSLRSIDQTVLDALWEGADPAELVERFRSAADDPAYDEQARAELATQLARALGLSGQLADADAVLDSIDVDGSPVVEARVALERGRLRAGQDDVEAAVPLLTRAARAAATAQVSFLALEALHLLAIIDTGHEEEWSDMAFSVLERATQPRTRRWGVALHNNLAWHLHDNGRAEEALAHFERALAYADEVGTGQQRFVARWALGRCLRTLGRTDEALAIQRKLARKRPDDAYVTAELAELEGAVDVGGAP